MNLAPFAQAPLAIKLHVATIVPAFFLGTWLILFSRKGGPGHRAIGVAYLTLMTITATIAIFIRQLNPGGFSFFHLFILLTYSGVFRSIWFLRKKNIAGHKRAMLGLYIGGLVVAGGLTFTP